MAQRARPGGNSVRFLRQMGKAIWNALVGMRVTIRNMVLRPRITLQYPNERWDVPVGSRGIPVLLSNEEGQLKCIVCELCEKICPVHVIEIKYHRDEQTRKKALDEFNLDASRCMLCGLCAEVCPAEAIAMSDHYELAEYDLPSLVYDKEKLQQLGLPQKTPIVNFGVKTEGQPVKRS